MWQNAKRRASTSLVQTARRTASAANSPSRVRRPKVKSPQAPDSQNALEEITPAAKIKLQISPELLTAASTGQKTGTFMTGLKSPQSIRQPEIVLTPPAEKSPGLLAATDTRRTPNRVLLVPPTSAHHLHRHVRNKKEVRDLSAGGVQGKSRTRPLTKSLTTVGVDEMLDSARIVHKAVATQHNKKMKEQVLKKVKEFEEAKRDPRKARKSEPIGKICGIFAKSNIVDTPAKFRRPLSSVENEETSPADSRSPRRPRTAVSARSSPARVTFFRKDERGSRWARFSKFLRKCVVEQEEVASDLVMAEKIQKQLKTDLETIRTGLDKKGEIEQKKRKEHVEHMARCKPLFVYGENGRGRFVTPGGVDLVRASDLVLRINPKYKFLDGAFGRLLIKNQ